MSTIAYDIEVVGPSLEELDEGTRQYLHKKAKDEAEWAAMGERTALLPGLGRVIAIGLWNVDAKRGLLLLEGASAPRMPHPTLADCEVLRGTEPELLRAFWEVVERQNPRLVTYNGRGFDGPVLMLRSAQAGIVCSRDLVGYRYDIAQHCDLMDALSFLGARREHYSLDYWCRRFGVESPKGGLDGSEVGRAYGEGRIEEIGTYCMGDVRATAELYQRLAPTLLHLIRGGPKAAR